MNIDPYADKLGIINALAVYLAQGGQTDDIADHLIFSGVINRIVTKMELVIDENFGGDSVAFHRQLLTTILFASLEGKDPVTAINKWLDIQWHESGKLYH